MKCAGPQHFIDIINQQQNEYYAYDFMIKSKNFIFKGCKRIYINTNEESQKIIPPPISQAYALKLQKTNSHEDINQHIRVHHILHFFSNDSRVIQNEGVHEIQATFGHYLMVPTKFYPLKDINEYLRRNVTNLKVEYTEFIRLASFQALHILVLLKTYHIVHNDFKFENLIVTEEPILEQPQLPFNILVFDFDDAEEVPENGLSIHIGGTKIFNAPEKQRYLPHDYSVDIWSLGVNIFLYLALNRLPFDIRNEDTYETIYQKTKQDLINYNDVIPEDAFEVIQMMLKFNPNERITPEEALEMDWFAGLEPVVPRRVDTINTDAVKDNHTDA
ncbi:hypothetical protein M9Y10_024714 [Tritrichomonas musculus]|uniref:Protein kinase domain-containing protein n=1 Tax=Tritrichomonas musculus TaxID=1915356 RepID=A0ABR2HB23_9EUKA